MASNNEVIKVTQDVSNRYKDKVVLITGGSRGIGEGIARTFVRAGSKVVITDVRPEPNWLAEVNSQKLGEVTYIKCDVSQEAEVIELVRKTVEKYGRLDCAVNNAAVKSQHTPIDDVTVDEFQRVTNVNVLGGFLISKHCLPHLRLVQGSIIFIASIVGKIGQLYASLYATTKGAVLALARGLAIDEAKYHVRVNSISPGNVFSPLWLETLSGNSTEKEINDVKQTANEAQLLGHMGTYEDIGLACLYFADAQFITGVDLNLSGGAELDFGFKTRIGEEEVFRWSSLTKKINK